jgi:hypothetical protein
VLRGLLGGERSTVDVRACAQRLELCASHTDLTFCLRIAVLLASCCLAGSATAQTLPSEPITFGGGRVVLGGDLGASFGSEDEGFFNYGDYEHSTLREFRIGLTAQVRANRRISVLAEVRAENLNHVSPFALYVRVRPFPSRRFDIQAGRIPPTFGRFSRQAYSRDNPLIGYPLAYQYLTSLRADALPADADELFRMRGRGWLSSFTVGSGTAAPGVPLVTAFRWDTGIQVTTGWKAVEITGAVTNGTLSNPRVSDDNSGKQVATRVVIKPFSGLQVGSSFARGAFVSRTALEALGSIDGDDFVQLAHGLDVEYSRGHWLTRAEAVASEWRVPLMAAGRVEPLRAVAFGVEGRYAFQPGMYAAARADHLAFNRIDGSTQRLAWDAPVTRVEVGAGYYVQRNVIARVSFQVNRRDGGRIRASELVAGQVLFWF